MDTVQPYFLYPVIYSVLTSFCIYPPLPPSHPPSSPASVIPHGPIIISKKNSGLLHSRAPEILWILNHTPHEQSTWGSLVHHERCNRKGNICNTDRPPCSSTQWCQQEIQCSPARPTVYLHNYEKINLKYATLLSNLRSGWFSPTEIGCFSLPFLAT